MSGFRLRTRLGALAIIAATSLGAVAATMDSAAAAATTPQATQGVARARIDDPMAGVALHAIEDLTTYGQAGDNVALAAFQTARDQIATEMATRLGIDPLRMIAAWQQADLTHQKALMGAFTQLGVPYRRNTSKAGEGFDCSGLTTYAWGVAGVTLTRQSGAQIKSAAARTQDTAMAGDLIYYPGHVMMWLGVDTAIVHSPYTGRNVEVDMLAKRRNPRFGNPIG